MFGGVKYPGVNTWGEYVQGCEYPDVTKGTKGGGEYPDQ